MKKLVLVLLLVGLVGFTVTMAVKRRFYVYASAETESAFFKVFEGKSQIKPYVRRHCLSWQSDGGQSGWRSASHVREFHENIVVKANESTLLTTNLQRLLSGQLSLNGTHILRTFGDAETGFGFDYAEGNTLGTVTVYPIKVPAGCFECVSVALDEVAVRLDVSIQEERFAVKPTAATIEKFIQDRTFEKLASEGEDSSLVADFSRSTKSHAVACADAFRARLLEKGITLSQDPNDPTELVMNLLGDYYKR